MQGVITDLPLIPSVNDFSDLPEKAIPRMKHRIIHSASRKPCKVSAVSLEFSMLLCK